MHKKNIGGVCAGFADFMGVDVTLIRIIWLCLAIFTGVGFIAYLVCWIVMEKDYGSSTVSEAVQSQPPAQPAVVDQRA